MSGFFTDMPLGRLPSGTGDQFEFFLAELVLDLLGKDTQRLVAHFVGIVGRRRCGILRTLGHLYLARSGHFSPPLGIRSELGGGGEQCNAAEAMGFPLATGPSCNFLAGAQDTNGVGRHNAAELVRKEVIKGNRYHAHEFWLPLE